MPSAWKRRNYRIALGALRLWARPTVGGLERLAGKVHPSASPPAEGGNAGSGGDAAAALQRQQAAGDVVYALANRSLADVLLLDLIAERGGLPSPIAPLPRYDEARRFFFLHRPTGLWRRNTMRAATGASARMRRLEAKLRARSEVCPEGGTEDVPRHRALWLAPVSIFWGRAANKDRSWVRSLFSEGWAVSSRLRRLLILLFNRRDILVQFGEPLPWHDVVRAGGQALSEERVTRRTARLLRAKFRNQKVAALGPDLSHRRTLAAQILRSAPVAAAIAAEAANAPARRKLERRARQAVFTIAADMSYPAVRFLDRLLTWLWHRVYQGVRVSGVDNVRAFAQTHTLVYTPCHRSHVDYLLVSHVLHHEGLMLPHIAAGDNLDLPLVGRVLRGGGAFFMRRSFARDRIYKAVFGEYLYQVFRRGHSVEYFVEGGRTRTGRLLPPRFGLLQMTYNAQRRGLPRPIAFVPVYIGYEKVMEAGSYADELRGADKKSETVGDVLRGLRLARQFHGTAQVRFAPPVMFDAFLAERDRGPEQAVRALGGRILAAINANAVVNATQLVALATLSTPRQAIEESTLAAQIDLYRQLIRAAPPGCDYEVDDAAAAELVRRVERLGLLTRETSSTGDVLRHDAFASVLMTWYRNNVLHVLAAPALLACLVVNRRRGIRHAHVRRLFQTVFPYLASELRIGAEGQVDHWLAELRGAGLVEARGEGFAAPAKPAARFRLRLLANTVMHVLERFYMAVVLLTNAGAGVVDRRALLADCRANAKRISTLYGIGAPEFADARLFEGLLQGLVNDGVVSVDCDGKLAFDGRIAEITRAGRGVIAAELRQAIDGLVARGA